MGAFISSDTVSASVSGVVFPEINGVIKPETLIHAAKTAIMIVKNATTKFDFRNRSLAWRKNKTELKRPIVQAKK